MDGDRDLDVVVFGATGFAALATRLRSPGMTLAAQRSGRPGVPTG